MPKKNLTKPSRNDDRPRRLKPVKGKLFGTVKKKKYKLDLPSAWKIFKNSNKHIWAHKKLFGGIVLIYIALSMLLVRGFSITTDLGTAKEAFSELFKGSLSNAASFVSVLAVLVGNSSPASQAAGIYQSVIYIIITLTVIWALRQTYAKEKITLKDSFYKSTTPLVPYILVTMVIGLQLLPIVISSVVYGFVMGSGIVSGAAQVVIIAIPLFLMAVWSIYMISASVFALYIVTLPGSTPLQALRAAKKVVRYRRWTVIRKFLFMPTILVALLLLIMLPVIVWVPVIAEVVFIVASSSMLVLGNGYMYAFYRELIK